MQMIIGLLTVEIHILYSASLKEKRFILKSIKDKVRNKFNVSIAEVDYQEKWQRSVLAAAQVGNDYVVIEKNLYSVFNLIETYNGVEILKHTLEYL